MIAFLFITLTKVIEACW